MGQLIFSAFQKQKKYEKFNECVRETESDAERGGGDARGGQTETRRERKKIKRGRKRERKRERKRGRKRERERAGEREKTWVKEMKFL